LARVFFVAVVVDLIYEAVVFHELHPGQSVIVAAVLALLPYPLFRGLLNRIVRRWRQGHGGPRQGDAMIGQIKSP
jgi:hypothetical protein